MQNASIMNDLMNKDIKVPTNYGELLVEKLANAHLYKLIEKLVISCSSSDCNHHIVKM